MKQASRLRSLGLVLAFGLVVIAIAALARWLDTWTEALILLALVGVALVAARLLSNRIAKGTVIEMDLDKGVVEVTGSDPISKATTRGSVIVRDVVDALERAAEDDRIQGIVARVGNGKIQLGHAQEIRDAIQKVRGAGKKTVAFSETFGEGGAATVDYYLASAFEEIYLMPMGEVNATGLLARGRFVRGLLNKLGAVPEMDHREEYKAALYMLTETEMTEPHREGIHRLAGDQFEQVVAGIAESRGLDSDAVRDLINTAPQIGDRLVEDGLVDHRGYRNDAYRAAGGSPFLLYDRYLKKAKRVHSKGDTIALVFGSGMIARGSSGFSPLTSGPSFGSDDVSAALRKAADDDKVKAIVFRVDSPGGSAVASEVVRNEVVRAMSAGKPVVVSMGNVAASGGYWVSANATRIVAQPGTVTGSIGVVSGKLTTKEAWAKAGISFQDVGFGDQATFSSSMTPYNEDGQAKLNEQLDHIYDQFIELVSKGRDLSRERVRELAKGQVYTGSQALEVGLVDLLGGVSEAVEEARLAANLDDEVKVTVYPKSGPLDFLQSKENTEPAVEMVAAVVDGMRAAASDLEAGAQLRIPEVWYRRS